MFLECVFDSGGQWARLDKAALWCPVNKERGRFEVLISYPPRLVACACRSLFECAVPRLIKASTTSLFFLIFIYECSQPSSLSLCPPDYDLRGKSNFSQWLLHFVNHNIWLNTGSKFFFSHLQSPSILFLLSPWYFLQQSFCGWQTLSLSLSPCLHTNTHTTTPKPCCSKVKRLIESSGGGRADGWLSLKKAEPGDSWDNKPQVRPLLLPLTHRGGRRPRNAHTQKDARAPPTDPTFHFRFTPV